MILHLAVVATQGTGQANNYLGPELKFNLGLSSYDRSAGDIS